MAKVVVISDFSFSGSGYFNIIVPLCTNLANCGHEIKAAGLGYRGEPHNLPFSIIPANTYGDAQAIANNLKYQWGAEILIVALDIPQQERYIGLAKNLNIPIISIVPLENPPLTMSWAFLLQQSNKVFFISQLGADEATKAGLENNVEHLVVGMDTKSWRMRTNEEYVQGRETLNISPDTLVVLTVADNQERKNLSKAMEIVSKVKKKGIKVKYILVTRENSDVGWKLRDLALDYDIASETMIFERGMSFGELYALYAISDVFLLTSKAEGLGLPVMEAMSVGVPVVATACGAMPELLGDNEERGFLINTEYSMIDPWGNSRRDFPNTNHAVGLLEDIRCDFVKSVVGNARHYMETRTWEAPTNQMIIAIAELIHDKEQN